MKRSGLRLRRRKARGAENAAGTNMLPTVQAAVIVPSGHVPKGNGSLASADHRADAAAVAPAVAV